MKTEDIRTNQQVKIVKNNVYPVSPLVLGRTGHVVDQDGSVFIVRLDGGGYYSAFAEELEVTNGG